MTMTPKNHMFSGSETISIFEFSSRFVNEVKIIKMTEQQSFIALPQILENPSECKFRATFLLAPVMVG